MKKWLLLLSLFYLSAVAQNSNSIELIDFSDEYSGKIFLIEQTNEEFDGNCQVVLYDKKTGKEVFSAFAFISEYDVENGQARTNIKQISYGEQSILIMEDFNFDGKKDVAIRSGFFSCYGGPSFNVYLATKKGFVLHDDLTRIASENCGMFTVDSQKKQLSTMAKSGCCWHQYSTYVIENNKVIPTEIIGEAYDGLFVKYNIQKLINGKMQTSTTTKIAENVTSEFIMFFENGKKMHLLNGFVDNLIYVFVDEDDNVELIYRDYFTFNKKQKSLLFTNEKTIYTITQNGISIIQGKKKYQLDSVKKSGSFEKINWENQTNVTITF